MGTDTATRRATLGGRVRVVAPELDRVAGVGSAAGIAACADHVPAAASDFFGFEVRPDRTGADLLVQLARPSWIADDMRALAGGDDRACRVLERLTRGLVDGRWHDVWVEYDLPAQATAAALPVPSTFCDPGPRGRASVASLSDELFGDSRRGAVAAAAVARAGADAHLFQVGSMVARDGGPIRLCMLVADVRHVLDVLAPLAVDPRGWRATCQPAAELADRVPDAAFVAVDVDVVDGGLRPAVALELHTAEAGPDAVCELIADQELAPREWVERVAAWPGEVRGLDSSALSSTGLSPVASFLAGHAEFGLLRTLNHVKVRFPPDEPPAAKAYLGLKVGAAVRLTPQRG